jgi:glycosyltransferase involved in cell wall biosynthesis
MSKLISVIVNCYNGEKYPNKTLQSIQSQKYRNWELIFWNNQSTDNSKKIFDSFKDNRFKYYYADKHTTLDEERNLTCKKSNGDFIAFLDCDDWWYENFLSSRDNFFSNNKYELSYSKSQLFFEKTIKSIIRNYKNIQLDILNDKIYSLKGFEIQIKKIIDC